MLRSEKTHPCGITEQAVERPSCRRIRYIEGCSILSENGEKEMGYLKRLVILALWTPAAFLFSDVVNKDRPLKGEWNLNLRKVWEIARAGTDVFLEPDRLQAAVDGTLYVHDEMNRVNYIFDQDGRFVRSFGKRGQGPGEIQEQKGFYLVGKTLILVDTAKLHYFTEDGEYLKSEDNYYYRRRPVAFINERQFIACPLGIFEALDGKGKVSLVDLDSGKDMVINEFTIFQGGVAREGGLVGSLIIEGLTPLMVVGFGDNKVYYGMSDAYTIHIADLNGKQAGDFSLQRAKRKVPAEEKALRFEEFPRMRADARKQIMETTPDETTFFNRIESHNGLVYVFEPVVNRGNSQPIDIFSPEGKYLYRSTIAVEEGLTMTPQQSANPLLTNEHLYVVLADQDSKVRIIKYKISLPLPSA